MRMRLYEERFCFVATAMFACASLNLYAAGGTWQGTTNSDWNVATNWQGGVIPGQTTDTTNRDLVTFNKGSNYLWTVLPDAGRVIGSVSFYQASAGNAGNYTIGTIGGTPLALAGIGSGAMQVDSTLTTSNVTETVNAPLVLYGSYAFINASPTVSTTLRLNGAIYSGTNAAITVALKGTSLGANTVGGVISNGASPVSVQIPTLASSTGTWVLAAANTYTGATIVGVGTLIAAVDAPSGAPGAFGNATNAIAVGANTTLGNAALLAGYGTNGVTIARPISVPSLSAATQTVTFGSANTNGASQFRGDISLNRGVTLQAAAGGTVDFNTGIWTTRNYPIIVGSPGNTGLVSIGNVMNTTAGVTVAYGTLAVNSNLTSFVIVSNNAVLTGSGRIVTNGSTTAISVAAGGTIDPGTVGGIGTLIVTGNVVFASGGQFRVQASGNTADLLTVTGNVTTPGGPVSVLATASGQGPWRILRATSVDSSFTSATPGFTVSRRNGNTELWLGRVGGVIFMR